MEEKEKKKKEELQLKEERRIARDLKAQAKAKKSALKAASVRGKKSGTTSTTFRSKTVLPERGRSLEDGE